LRVLVTGATGFLGRHLLRRLSEEHDVVGMARNIPLHADFPHVPGDVTAPASLAPALEGIDAVVHAAGQVSHLPADAGRTWDVHVKGTTNLLDAAAAAGVRRVVHLSSSGTVAVSTRPELLGEDGPSPLPIIGGWPYYRAKLFSEQLALARSRPGFEVLALNPSLLLGPGDLKHESTRPVVLFLQGQLSAVPSGGVSFVDVRDVALAAARALSHGAPGQRYLLSGANWSWTEFYRRLAELTGLRPPAFTMPAASRRALDWIPEARRESVGRHLPISLAELELASHYWYVDDRKARRALAWSSRDPMETLLDTVRGV